MHVFYFIIILLELLFSFLKFFFSKKIMYICMYFERETVCKHTREKEKQIPAEWGARHVAPSQDPDPEMLKQLSRPDVPKKNFKGPI